MSKKPEHVFLIDGSGFIFRAYYGIKADMTNPGGTPVNAVFGFTKMLMKLVADTDADHIAVVFDRARKTFRNDIYPEYKANRSDPPEDLIPQFALVRDAAKALNVAAVDMEGFEADDLIATYAKLAVAAGADVTIVSSDKDLMQLVGPKVVMLDAMTDKIIGPDQVFEKFGVGPEKVIEVQALAGDSSDNVPGVSGIGVKTAAQLINEYGDLETLLARAGEIKQPKRRENLLGEADAARLSLDLVTLRDDVPVEHGLDYFAIRQPTAETLLPFLRAMGFKSLLKTAEARFGVAPSASSPDGEEPGHESPPNEQAQAKEVSSRYELVQTKEALQAWVDQATKAGFVAVDTETTGLDAMRADLVGVSLSIEPGRACYVPLGHKKPAAQGTFDLGGDGGSDGGGGLPSPKRSSGFAQAGEVPDQIPIKDAVKILKPLLEDPSVLKIGQNIKYDMKVLVRHGINIAPIDDTMLLSYVLDGGLHGHGMDELALRFLDHQTIKYADVTGTGKAKVTFDMVSLDRALDYAAEDADITARLHRCLKPRLVQDRMTTVYETLERPLIPILEAMERTGIKVDGKELKRLSDDFAARLAVLEGEIYKLAGREFNVGSPKQLGEILFDELGLPGGKKGKTGAYATGVEVLEALADHGHELPVKMIDWRQLAKLKSTYSDALTEQINPATGRVHTSYSQGAVATGRLASSNPNLQNIPIRTEEGRKIRRAFVADKGMTLLSADYSQIELRLLAHVAGIDVLKDAFRDGQDIHAMTASQVFGVPMDGMDPMVRRKAKAINFGIIYGISAFGLARQLGIGNSEAGEYINSYFEKYPGIRDYMERTKEQARTKGYVETLFGRKCHIKSINEKNPNVRGLGERAAINAPIQGGAADIIKRAMIRLPDALAAKKLKAVMLLQVHDELIFEVPKKELKETTEVVKKIMEGAAHLDVPLVVDVGSGDNWDDAH
ncbi:MAG: DNA polymerase I [Rhodospirillales bacterium]|nr:DNA polymerase I [Rhodospirillales bacterium]